MNAVKQDVEKLVQKELESANQRFPMFRSDHEGAAVVLEEIEESRQEMNEVELQFRGMWNKVKADYRSSIFQARHIYIHSLNLACEAIQIAAMAQKFIDSQKEREKINMSELEITVKHSVSPDMEHCTYGGDFWGKDVCRYHTHRDRTHGRKAPIERHLPKCTLFNKWLDKPYQKCEECKQACQKEGEKNEDN